MAGSWRSILCGSTRHRDPGTRPIPMRRFGRPDCGQTRHRGTRSAVLPSYGKEGRHGSSRALRRTGLASFLTLMLVASSQASAQALQSFEDLALRVNLDDQLQVEDQSGVKATGRLTQLTRDEIAIQTEAGGSASRAIPFARSRCADTPSVRVHSSELRCSRSWAWWRPARTKGVRAAASLECWRRPDRRGRRTGDRRPHPSDEACLPRARGPRVHSAVARGRQRSGQPARGPCASGQPQ